MQRAGITALAVLIAAGCTHGGELRAQSCTYLVVDRERAPACPTPASLDGGWELDLDRPTRSEGARRARAVSRDLITIDGRDYQAAIGEHRLLVTPGSAWGEMALFPAAGGVALHHADSKLPGDHSLLGTSTRAIEGGDVLWVVHTSYARWKSRGGARYRDVLYAVIDGALAVVRTEAVAESVKSPARLSYSSALPIADTCTATQQLERLRYGTRLERLATLVALHRQVFEDDWYELAPALRAAIGELATSCDEWVRDEARSVIVSGVRTSRMRAANPRPEPPDLSDDG